jgi:hypothetical protein
MIHEVEEGKDYAVLLSTAAGAWRYLIGDTVRFTDKDRSEISNSGRTKHYHSLVGKHVSVDNMNQAIQFAGEQLNVALPEFTVAGVHHETLFAHHWYVGCDDPVDAERLRLVIDEKLKELNDDYAVERTSALKAVKLDILPVQSFMEFMRLKGKMGGQHKFPRVLKGRILEEWQQFVATGSI